MFNFAIFVGIYAYLILLFGITGILYKELVITITCVFIAIFLIFIFRSIKASSFTTFFQNKYILFLSTLIFIQVLVNYVGVLGPELSFDALWYHLTLPKLYLINHSIFHIPGGLLYYSDMPKLGELLYVGALSLGNEIMAKSVHFIFGILTAISIFLLTRTFLPTFFALIAVVIFYSNIVVAWESTTAYVDLIRSFFEVMALWSFVNWLQTKKEKWFYFLGIMTGLAVTTKLLAFGTAIIFTLLISYVLLKKRERFIIIAKKVITYLLFVIAVPLPWFIFAYINTGNPVYPFFSELYQITPEPFSLGKIVADFWILFTKAADPISPIYLILIPLLFMTYPKLNKESKLVTWYSLCAVILWYFTPRTGGGRFILPYLPAFSIMCAAIIHVMSKGTKQYSRAFFRALLLLVLVISLITLGYRGAANSKYIPVIMGQQTKGNFLSENLNFSFGDFYDTDNFFKNHITSSDRVLLFGFHNLYYVDFPFIDSTWIKSGDSFNYIATQNTQLPKEYHGWHLIYSNAKTMVKLYAPPKGACKETCIY